MKILFLTSNLKNIGGIQKYDRDFIRALKENDAKVIVAELKKSNFFLEIIFIFEIFIKIFRHKPNIIICSHINFAPIGYFFKILFKKEYIILTYGIDVFGLKGRLKFKAIKGAKILVTISNYTKEKLISQMPGIETKIFLLSNSIDGDEFEPQEKPQGLLRKFNLSDKKIILTVARLSLSEQYKGYDKIIRSLPKIIEEIPNTIYILIGSGDDTERIKKLINDLGLTEYVIMPGFVSKEELLSYYNLCDVFIMPSKGEGFGFVFLEALACGKPVVAGNRDGSRDALLGGELGILVDPDNIKEISEMIIKVLKKEIPSRLLNPEYLRKAVLDAYGTDKFKLKTGELLGLL